MTKEKYVNTILGLAVMTANKDVKAIDYRTFDVTEFVYIQYNNGHRVTVDVTGDSLNGMVVDVFNYLLLN